MREDLSNSRQHYFQFLSAFQGCLTLCPSSFEPFLTWEKSLKNSEALFPFSIMFCCLSFSFFSSFDLCNENGHASKLRIPAVFPFRSRFLFQIKHFHTRQKQKRTKPTSSACLWTLIMHEVPVGKKASAS